MQTCIAPDYVLVPKDRQDALVQALRENISTFYPEGAMHSASYGRIVSSSHFERLKALLSRSKGVIAAGGETNDQALKFAPTIVKDVTGGDSLMEEQVIITKMNILNANER